MRYLIFTTEAEAEAAQAAIWDAIKPAHEYRNGKPVPPITVKWDTPIQLNNGTWAIHSHNNEGVEIDESLWPNVGED